MKNLPKNIWATLGFKNFKKVYVYVEDSEITLSVWDGQRYDAWTDEWDSPILEGFCKFDDIVRAWFDIKDGEFPTHDQYLEIANHYNRRKAA